MAKKITKPIEDTEPKDEEAETPKSKKKEYRVVGTYNNQPIDRVYTEKELAESLAKKIGGVIK